MSDRLKNHGRFRIPDSVRKLGVTATASYVYLFLASGLHEQLGIVASPISSYLAKATENIDRFKLDMGPAGIWAVGHYGLISPIKFINDMVSQAVQLDLSRPELINFIDALLLGVPLVAVGALGLGELVKSVTKNEARLFGEEPIKDNAIPSHVIITPTTEILEGMVASGHASGKLKNSKRGEVVGIHFDQGIPLGSLTDNRIGHHFAVGAMEELTGLPGAEESEIPRLVRESGLDRAREITINCVPDNRGLFYDTENRSRFGPEIIMDILRLIKVKGKIINIILPKERNNTVSERLTKFHQRLKEMGVDFGLNIITPEDEFIGLVREKASEIALEKDPGEPVHVLVLGQQTFDLNAASLQLTINEPDTDTQPLPDEMNFLLSCLIEDPAGDAKRILAEGVLISEYDDLKADAELSRQITNGDIIVLTAQSDRELIAVTERLVKAHGMFRGKMIVIADRQSTAAYLEKESKVDTFVASRAINEAFAKK